MLFIHMMKQICDSRS